MYPTLADTVGQTPLIRLQRLPGHTTNVILGDSGEIDSAPGLAHFFTFWAFIVLSLTIVEAYGSDGELFGIPREDWGRIQRWAELSTSTQDDEISGAFWLEPPEAIT